MRNFSPIYGLLALSVTVACIAAYPILHQSESPAVLEKINYQSTEKRLVLQSTDKIHIFRLLSKPMNGFYRYTLDLNNTTLGDAFPSLKLLAMQLRQSVPDIQSFSIRQFHEDNGTSPRIQLTLDMPVDMTGRQTTNIRLIHTHEGRIALQFFPEETVTASLPMTALPLPSQSVAMTEANKNENEQSNPVTTKSPSLSAHPSAHRIRHHAAESSSISLEQKTIQHQGPEIEALRRKIQLLRKAEHQLSKKVAKSTLSEKPASIRKQSQEMQYLQKESISLRDTIRTLQAKNQKSNPEAPDVSASLAGLSKKYADAMRHNKALQSALAEEKSQLRVHEAEVPKSEWLDLKNKYNAELHKNHDLQNALALEKKQMNQLEQSRLDSKNDAKSDSLPALKTMKDQLTQAKTGLAGAIATISSQNAELSRLKEQLNTVKEGVSDTAKEQLSFVNEKLEEREAEVAQLKKKIAGLMSGSPRSLVMNGTSVGQTALSDADSDASTYKDQYFEMKKQLENSQEQLKLVKSSEESEISALKLTIQERDQQLAQLSGNARNIVENITKSSDAADTSSAMLALQEKNNQLKSQVDNLNSKMQSLQAQNATLKQSGNAVLQDSKNGSDRNQDKKSLSDADTSDLDAGALKKTLLVMNQKYDDLSHEKDVLQQNLETEKKLHRKEDDRENYRYQLQQAEISLHDLREKLADLQKQNSSTVRLKDADKSLKKENERLTVALMKLEKTKSEKAQAEQTSIAQKNVVQNEPTQIAQAQLQLADEPAVASRPDPEYMTMKAQLQKAQADAAKVENLQHENQRLALVNQDFQVQLNAMRGQLKQSELQKGPQNGDLNTYSQMISLSALNNYAASLKKVGRTDEAESIFRLGLMLNPQDVNLLFNLGNLYNTMNKSEQAKETYLQALRVKPDFPMAHYNLGLIYAKLGDNANAIQHLDQYLQLEPQADNRQQIQTYIAQLKN